MNNWMKLGIAGIAIAGSLSANGSDFSEVKKDAQFNQAIQIEATDLIAKKKRDYRQELPVERPMLEEEEESLLIEASDLVAKKMRDRRREKESQVHA